MSQHNLLSDGQISPEHFATSFWGFRAGVGDTAPLYHVQRFVLKVLYGVPLDSTQKRIAIGCPVFGDDVSYLTETDYLSYLYDSGRISTRDLKNQFRGLVLVCGVRGGKTELLTTILGYETFRLLQLDSPARKLGLEDGSKITMGVIGAAYAPSYDVLADKIGRSPYFASLQQRYSRRVTTLKSTRDLREGAKNDFSVQISKLSKVPKGAIHSLLVDDASFLPPKSARQMKETFSGGDNTLAGKGKLLIGSEADKEFSFLWEEYYKADLHGDGENMLAMRIPSWELNPNIPVAFLHAQYAKLGAKGFAARYNASFAEKGGG